MLLVAVLCSAWLGPSPVLAAQYAPAPAPAAAPAAAAAPASGLAPAAKHYDFHVTLAMTSLDCFGAALGVCQR